MGFYAPSQLVQDARRHGVEVRPVDVCSSDWDCTLEPGEDGEPALRLGLRLAKGLPEAAARRLVEARAPRRLRGRAVARDRAPRSTAASSAPSPRQAPSRRWQATVTAPRGTWRAWRRRCRSCPSRASRRASRCCARRARARTSSRTTPNRAHPRPPSAGAAARAARGARLVHGRELRELPHGATVRTAGLVITRQRPGSAGGVTFVTLEDETGSINLIVWRDVAERQRRALVGSRLMGVAGELQLRGGGPARDRCGGSPTSRGGSARWLRRRATFTRPRGGVRATPARGLAAVADVVVVEVEQQLRGALLLHQPLELAPRGLRARAPRRACACRGPA